MNNRQLSPGDKLVLESYAGLLPGLVDYLGEGFEIVLHSLEDLEKSVIAIINGHHTGRTVGAPITDLALSMLGKIEEDGVDKYISYFNRNKRGEPLKCATIAIRGEGNRVIGLLCINFYMNTPMCDFLSSWMPGMHTAGPLFKDITENYSEDANELVANALAEVYPLVMQDLSVSSVNKNREIIARLYEKGVFNLKNAVILTADRLGISKTTVYMHLRNLHK